MIIFVLPMITYMYTCDVVMVANLLRLKKGTEIKFVSLIESLLFEKIFHLSIMILLC